MNHYQQIIDLCKKELGSMVLYTNVEDQDRGKTLFLEIDGSREEEVYNFYPCIENNIIQTKESASNGLNVYIYSGNKAHFYYCGFVTENASGERSIEPCDSDGDAYEKDSVLSIEFSQPEEIVEWIRFILDFKHGDVDDQEIRINWEDKPYTHWFEELKVFLPSFAGKIAPFEKVQSKVDVYELPALYNKTSHFGTLDTSNYDIDSSEFQEKVRTMNAEGAEETNQFARVYVEMANASTDTIQAGDFLVYIGSKGAVTSYHSFDPADEEDNSLYYLVLRPKAGVSFAAVHDFLHYEQAGIDFLKALVNPAASRTEQICFIPEFTAQQHYILLKKLGIARLERLIASIKKGRSHAGNILDKISKATNALKDIQDNK